MNNDKIKMQSSPQSLGRASRKDLKVLLTVSLNYSIFMLNEEIGNIRRGACDFTKSVDWRFCLPLGILYIAGTLRKVGYEVHIYDLHRAFFKCRESGYFLFHDLENFFQDHFVNILRSIRPDVLGIGSLFNVSSSSVSEMARWARQVNPTMSIIMGGHYPSNQYKAILKKEEACDYIILGEAEEPFPWLLDHLHDPDISDIVAEHPNIVDQHCYRAEHKTKAIVENLDDLAPPAYDLLPDVDEYLEKSLHSQRMGSQLFSKTRAAAICSSRGCPMQCTFCAAHGVHGRKYRMHSLDYIMDSIDWLVQKYDINQILIEDDMFNLRKERTIAFCERLVGKYGARFSLEFPNGLACWILDDEVVGHLKKAGLRTITFAIESGSQYVQKHIIKKNLDLNLVSEKVKVLRKHGINVRAFFIVGFIGETLAQMKETVQYALTLDADWCEIKILTPLAGSEMYELAVKHNYLSGDTNEHVYGRSCLNTPEFAAQQVKEIQYDANIRINFLNNKQLRDKNYDEAEKTFGSILKNYPNHIFAQWGLLQALKGQQKDQEARLALDRLVALAQENKRNREVIKKYNIELS